jgi:hypothetical protein
MCPQKQDTTLGMNGSMGNAEATTSLDCVLRCVTPFAVASKLLQLRLDAAHIDHRRG